MLDNIFVNAGELKEALKVLSKKMPTSRGDVWDMVRINVGALRDADNDAPHLYLTAVVNDHYAAFMEINIPCVDYDVDLNKPFRIIASISALKKAAAAIPNKENAFLSFYRDGDENVKSLVLMDKSGGSSQFVHRGEVSYYMNGDYKSEFGQNWLDGRDRQSTGRIMSLPYDDFFGAIERTRRSISQEETRYYLNGVCMHNGEQVHFCSTDGHRLTHTTIDSNSSREDRSKVIGKGIPDGTIIPFAIVNKISDTMKSKALHKWNLPLSVFLERNDDSCIKIFCDNWRILFHPIPQRFPDYDATVLADKNDPKDSIQFNRKELRDAVTELVKFDKESRMVLMSNSKESKGKILLEALSADGGRKIELSVSSEGSLPRPARFNKRYILDVMDSMGADEISLNFPLEYGNPVYWKDISIRENMDDFLLMPVSVSDYEIKERS